MLEVNKTHEEFSNVAEDDQKKTEDPENPEKKRRGEDFGAMSPGGIFSYNSLEKLWNQMRLDMFLQWSWVYYFFLVLFWLFIFLQTYKILRQIEFQVLRRGFLFWRENPSWFPVNPFCTPDEKILRLAKLQCEGLDDAKNQIVELKEALNQKAPVPVSGAVSGASKAVSGAVPVSGAPGGPAVPAVPAVPAGAAFGALKKKRISLKR